MKTVLYFEKCVSFNYTDYIFAPLKQWQILYYFLLVYIFRSLRVKILQVAPDSWTQLMFFNSHYLKKKNLNLSFTFQKYFAFTSLEKNLENNKLNKEARQNGQRNKSSLFLYGTWNKQD